MTCCRHHENAKISRFPRGRRLVDEASHREDPFIFLTSIAGLITRNERQAITCPRSKGLWSYLHGNYSIWAWNLYFQVRLEITIPCPSGRSRLKKESWATLIMIWTSCPDREGCKPVGYAELPVKLVKSRAIHSCAAEVCFAHNVSPALHSLLFFP